MQIQKDTQASSCGVPSAGQLAANALVSLFGGAG